MLRLHALKKDWFRRFLAQKKINVGIELVFFVSYWNYSWSSLKKKMEPRLPSQTNWTKVVSKQEVSRK